MKKLHSFAFYAVFTPVITLGAGSLLAQQSTDQNMGMDMDSEQQSPQRDQDSTQPAPWPKQADQNMHDQSRMENRGYIASAPVNGSRASNLIGAEVRTSGGDEVGPVSDLIIDENGQVVAIVVGVGGFLGMGQRDVAIGWDDVIKSGTSSDKNDLQVNMTSDSLMSAPEFKRAD